MKLTFFLKSALATENIRMKIAALSKTYFCDGTYFTPILVEFELVYLAWDDL